MIVIDVDVFIVGFGIVGVSVVIEVYDVGVRVFIVEKMLVGGGNCQWFGGFFYVVDGFMVIDYFDVVCYGKIDCLVFEVYVVGICEIFIWIEFLGGVVCLLFLVIFVCFWLYFLGGGNDCVYWQFDSGYNFLGFVFWVCLEQVVCDCGIWVELNMVIVDFVVDDGIVCGVVLELGGQWCMVMVSVVIFVSGGIEYNVDMCEIYFVFLVKLIGYFGNIGDVVMLVQKVGGVLWYMLTGLGWLVYVCFEFLVVFGIDLMMAFSFLVIDEDGCCFVDEMGVEQVYDFGWFYFCFVS